MQQSELALFAQAFRRVLAPLQAELGRAQDCLRSSAGARDLPLDADELGENLAALAGELAELAGRVERERAAVFVFGPPKSGKSTLLDALAGARVGETSILPGYPCVLRAGHGRVESAALQHFDGTFEIVSDPGVLRLVLQRAHAELIASVRAARACGEAFDPARHLLSAVRRVECAQPAEPLAQAALELVECPPVHAPLFPSYAEMLIGEPEQARAAVFVVRAAQLADASAFDGIEELLAAFERLVLVLNLDGRGRELSRSGELIASAEREDPARLVAAFEELSPCEALALAVRGGRVPVLALDLQEVARMRLHGGGEDSGASARQRTRFEDLERALAGVLDRHEAFHALARSALRRAGELLAEVRELSATPALGELERRRDAAEAERAALETVLRAQARLGARARAPWEAEELFDGLRSRLAERAARRAAELARELETPLARLIEDWFADGASLQELLEERLAPRLELARGELLRAAERALREELRRACERPAFSAAVRSDQAEARLELAPVLLTCAERVRLALAPVPLRALDVEAIPVRPRLGQRLTWRAAGDVRRRLFGPPEDPSEPLPSAEKARRLGDEARATMKRSAAERARAILAEEGRRAARALDEALFSDFLAELGARVAAERARLDEPVLTLEARVAELAALATALEVLAPACERARAGLAELGERFEPIAELVPLARALPSASMGAASSPVPAVRGQTLPSAGRTSRAARAPSLD